MIKIFRGFEELRLDTFFFPAGEVGVKLDTENYKYKFNEHYQFQTIVARIQNSNDLITLALVKDALYRLIPIPIKLFLPYVPYARQDRVCVKGESFSLKVLANFINSLNFDQVTIIDPHSDVCEAIFDRVNVITQFDIIHCFDKFIKYVIDDKPLFISPDAGSNKKTSQLAKYFSHTEFIRADKLRNLHNGEIKETIVYADNLTGRDIVCCDDICDGGRTFTELAKVVKTKGAKKFVLYITHGIFTKGTDILYKEGIDEIYTTNSYYDTLPAGISDKVKILDINSVFVK